MTTFAATPYLGPLSSASKKFVIAGGGPGRESEPHAHAEIKWYRKMIVLYNLWPRFECLYAKIVQMMIISKNAP